MSLRSKIALVLFVAVAAFSGVDLVLGQMEVSPRTLELDRAAARERMARIEAVLATELRRLESAAEATLKSPDWSSDATPHVDVIARYDARGRVLTRHVAESATPAQAPLRELPNEQLGPSHPLLRRKDGQGQPKGLWVTSSGPLLIAVRQSSPAGPSVAAGTFIDDDFLERARAVSGVDFSATPVRADLPEEEMERVYALELDPVALEVKDDQTLVAWGLSLDLGEQPGLLLRAESSREHEAMRREQLRQKLLSSAAIVLLFPLVLLKLLQGIVTGPLTRLTQHASAIGQSDETTARLDLKRTDEIGELAHEFDRMLEKLEASRADVVRSARLAGMSDIATGTLHNFGNALNSVTTSAHMSRKNLGDMSNLSDLRRIQRELVARVGLLDDYLTQDERGKHLLPLLAALIERLETQFRETTSELADLDQGIDEITHLLGDLQEISGHTGLLESLRIGELLDSVVGLVVRSAQADGVEIRRQYADVPEIRHDRHRLTQILGSLIRNALDSIAVNPDSNLRLGLRIEVEDAATIRIEIQDDGVGIGSQALERVFSPDYSGRHGKRGATLHAAATLVAELGGQLSARSNGTNPGATFVLLLPTLAGRASASSAA